MTEQANKATRGRAEVTELTPLEEQTGQLCARSSCAVHISNLVHAYGASEVVSLEVPELTIHEGEAVLIVGKSGSGKSTLVNCINGVIPHIFPGDKAEINPNNKGRVSVLNEVVMETKLSKLSTIVGTLLQDPETQILNYRVEEEVAFGPENLCMTSEEISSRVREAVRIAGLEHLLEKETYNLSGGEMQRVALAGMLAMRPQIFVFDEPTSNIDPEGTAAIFEFLKAMRGKTMIIVEHKVERLLPFVDRIVLVDRGKVVLDIAKDKIFEHIEQLSESGVEIPEHYEVARHLGIGSVSVAAVRRAIRAMGISLEKPSRLVPGETVLETRAIVKSRAGMILDADLKLNRGEIFAVMGRNGAGKSTLLKSMIGFLDKELDVEQKLIAGGVDLSRANSTTKGRYLYYVPQNFDLTFVSNTVREEVSYSPRKKGMKDYAEMVSELLQLFSLDEIAERDPLTLSMGQRRRVAMASALASGATIIMLDEPTSGQDYYHRRSLGMELTKLKLRGFTFLVVTHDSRFVYWFADRMLVLEKGRKVLEGSPDQVFLDSETYGIAPPTDFKLRI